MSGIKEKIMSNISSGSSPSKQTILITGASGFVATHILTAFLEAGYNVRGTVRSEQTAKKVQNTHAKWNSKLSFAIVPDVAADSAFDEAVKDVDGVVHTASPFVVAGVQDNVKELLDPAIRGTQGILEAIQKNAPKVKRVVITSSFASIVDVMKGTWPEKTYTEADWNPVEYEMAASKDAPGGLAYAASKKVAEKAAWSYVEHNKPSFSLASICPPMIYGPVEQSVTSTEKLNTSSAEIYGLMNGSQKDVPETQFWAFVDVRDVAKAHLKAYEVPEAAGERFFITGGNFSYQQICDIIRKDFSEIKDKVPEGKPGSGLGAEVYKVDNSKSKKILGMEYLSLEKCIDDTVTSLLKVEHGQ